MKRYVVDPLETQERETLTAVTRKGSHRSQKVINALILLNCDAGEFNERRRDRIIAIAGVLSDQRAQGGPGQETVRGGRSGGGAGVSAGATCEVPAQGSGRGVQRRGWSRFSCGDPPEGHAQWSLTFAGRPRGGTRLMSTASRTRPCGGC